MNASAVPISTADPIAGAGGGVTTSVDAVAHALAPPDPARLATLGRRLREAVRGDVWLDAASLARYATDASMYQMTPLAVCAPASDADVAAALDVARDLKVPVLPRGAGTSQCGQSVNAALVLDCTKHLRRVVEIDPAARTAIVEPGLTLDALNAALKPHRLWFPVDVSTSAQATLGGMAGNNSCGSRSIAYGNMVHNVVGLDARLADGSVAHFGPMTQATGRAQALGDIAAQLAAERRDDLEALWPKVMRRVAGYNLDVFHPQSERPYTADGHVNLAHLLVGSEGTLAITERLHLALAPLPKARRLGVVNFARFHTAMDSAQHLVKLGPTAVELVDRTMIDLARANPAFRPVIDAALVHVDGAPPEAILLVEFAGDSTAPLDRALADLDTLMADLGQPGSVVRLVDEGAQKALWEVRKAGLNIMMSLRGDGKPVSFIEDCAVPLAHLAEYTAALTEVFERHGTRGTWYAHASVGTLHVRPILDLRRAGPEGGAAKMRAIANEAAALVRRFKGAFSGEHGDGLCRGEWIEWQYGPRITAALAQLKRAFDPDGLLNPGRIVDPPRMDDARLFRHPPRGDAADADTSVGGRSDRVGRALAPILDWSAWDVQNDPVTGALTAPGTGGDASRGFGKAVEMCNSNGHCRKFDAGTMCPSFRVTRDERDSTRGRAQTLRAALDGRLGSGDLLAPGLARDAVDAALDLCVGCKGCRRECPTGVDMARMKLEWTAQRAARGDVPWRDRLIGALPAVAPIAARFAGVLNLRTPGGVLARATERLTGFAADAPLPRWRPDRFDTHHARRLPLADRDTVLAAERGVVLWADTFDNAFAPENLVAAVRVLHAAGWQVHVAQRADGMRRPLCCGRTRLAVGQVEAAKVELRALLAALSPFAARGLSIVGLEPSCLFTLHDEAQALGLGDAARAVADRAMLFETFAAREAKAGRFAPPLRALDRPMVLHGHCHQKAFGAMPDVLAALMLIPEAKPQMIESSCCGMAGSFGLEAEHREVSMRMAKLALLPAVRNAPHDAIVVADGFSCRHRIAEGAGREAVHVARVLERALCAPAATRSH